MKTLVVYYSFTENNEKLARHLQEKLRCDIVKIETLKKRTGLSILFDLMFHRKPGIKTVPYYLRDYDHIIFVAPIWAGKIAMPLTTFLVNEKANIAQYSFITLCGGGNADQKKRIGDELRATIGKTPLKVVELWINNLLPAEKKNTIKYTSGYRIDPKEFQQFNAEISEVINQGQAMEK